MRAIAIDSIEATSATQIRVKLNKDVIDAYREDIEAGDDMPPVDVFHDGERYILSDGFHRYFAHIGANREEIDCNIHSGGMKEALIHAMGANHGHGLRRSNADKRHAVEMALKDPEISQMTRQEIADICRVTKRSVQKIAKQQEAAEPAAGINGEPKSPVDPESSDVRPAKKLTQEDVDLNDVREAMRLIGDLPYSGRRITALALTQDDCARLSYVHQWFKEAWEAINF